MSTVGYFSDDVELADRAATLLSSYRRIFERAVAGLAAQCLDRGKIASVHLDARQVPSYELALVSAELLAADINLSRLTPSTSALDRRLALIGAVEAMVSVGERLQTIALDVELDTGSLHALSLGADMTSLRIAILSGSALNSTGYLLNETQEDIGYIELGDELKMVQEQFRRIATDLVAPLAEQIHRLDLTVPESLLQSLRETGVFGLSVPERYGGSAPNERDATLMMLVVTEALSEASLAAAGSLITRPEILSRALLSGGTEAQKSHWLPKIAAGTPLCAIAITEPDYGSDVAGLQLRAVHTDGGWLLSGAKTWCTFAGKAGVLMVVARSHSDKSLGHRGLSVFLAEKPSYDGHEFDFHQRGGGRLAGKAIPTIGYRGMHSFSLAFENFFVPDFNVIGEEQGLGKGFYFTMAGMVGGRMQTAARAAGIMRAALLAALRYANDRKVFGASLATYSLTRAKLARMAARFVACRQLVYAIGLRLDIGGGRVESSLVKLFACRSAEWLTREALQIHGGMGYAEESAVSRYFVDARVLSIFEGAEETLALKVVARGLLEESLERPSILPRLIRSPS